jgi:hypothetical protein
MRTDYTIPALAIPFLIAVACNLPACYTQNKTQQEPQTIIVHDTVYLSDRAAVSIPHTCSDSSHHDCDGMCECDGLGCNTATNY